MEHVTLRDLAEELGVDRSALRRFAIKNHIVTVKLRDMKSRGSLCLAMTKDEAERLRRARLDQGYSDERFVGRGVGAPRSHDADSGVFYMIALVPDLKPGRIKLGYSSDLRGRLDAHRCSAPTLALLASWPCRRSWEAAAIAAMTNDKGVLKIGPESFDVQDVEAIRNRGKAFFAMLDGVA